MLIYTQRTYNSDIAPSQITKSAEARLRLSCTRLLRLLGELVALFLNLLIGPHLLALLAQVRDALLDLLELRLRDLLLGLLLLDLVAEGVELVLLVERLGLGRLLLGLLARLLGGVHPLGAGDGAAAVDHGPDLGAEGRVELALVRDDDDAAGVGLD